MGVPSVLLLASLLPCAVHMTDMQQSSAESSETGKVLLPIGAAEAFYYSNTPPHGSSGMGLIQGG